MPAYTFAVTFDCDLLAKNFQLYKTIGRQVLFRKNVVSEKNIFTISAASDLGNPTPALSVSIKESLFIRTLRIIF